LTIATGGEKIPEDMLADMSQYVEILVAYGSTELPILGYLFARNQKSTQEDGEVRNVCCPEPIQKFSERVVLHLTY
jgi:hypothetical protein